MTNETYHKINNIQNIKVYNEKRMRPYLLKLTNYSNYYVK